MNALKRRLISLFFGLASLLMLYITIDSKLSLGTIWNGMLVIFLAVLSFVIYKDDDAASGKSSGDKHSYKLSSAYIWLFTTFIIAELIYLFVNHNINIGILAFIQSFNLIIVLAVDLIRELVLYLKNKAQTKHE